MRQKITVILLSIIAILVLADILILTIYLQKTAKQDYSESKITKESVDLEEKNDSEKTNQEIGDEIIIADNIPPTEIEFLDQIPQDPIEREKIIDEWYIFKFAIEKIEENPDILNLLDTNYPEYLNTELQYNNIEKLQNLHQAMMDSENQTIKNYGQQMFADLNEAKNTANILLDKNQAYDNLKGFYEPTDILTNWFRYGYLYAYEPNKSMPLFTREARKILLI
ncbi:MAG: hypothetical protein GF365_03550 [Candidatus Buchananbacteria bacterium]|nr:hypothetical protein [Candidatus Buchananbacteria bacterium]